MWLTFVTGAVNGPAVNHMIVEFMVDSGAEYTVLPHDVWNAIALLPKRRERFVLADGTHVERDVSECHISLPQGEAHTPVILGQPGDDPLLGVVTLQILGFVLNPFKRSHQPARLRM